MNGIMFFSMVVIAVVLHFFEEAIGIKWNSSRHLSPISSHVVYMAIGAVLAWWILGLK